MMSQRRLRERQKKMWSRRGKRPWDEVHRDRDDRFILRLRTLFAMGMTDEFIANALDLNVYLVQILRNTKRRSKRTRSVARSESKAARRPEKGDTL